MARGGKNIVPSCFLSFCKEIGDNVIKYCLNLAHFIA